MSRGILGKFRLQGFLEKERKQQSLKKTLQLKYKIFQRDLDGKNQANVMAKNDSITGKAVSKGLLGFFSPLSFQCRNAKENYFITPL